MTENQIIPLVLTALGQISGQPHGPAPFAEDIKSLIDGPITLKSWETVSSLVVDTWFDDETTPYTNDEKADLKAELDKIAGKDTGDAPAANTTVGSIVGHIEDLTSA